MLLDQMCQVQLSCSGYPTPRILNFQLPWTLLIFVSLLIACAMSVMADDFSPKAFGDSDALSLLQVDLQVHRRVTPGFKVLHIGAPRSGTQTMYTALSTLGMHPLHTCYSYEVRGPWCNYALGNGSFEAAMLTMDSFDSAMDEPFHLIWEEIMHRFPDCKFILTESDPETWYKSFWELLNPLPTDSSAQAVAHIDAHSVVDKCRGAHYWGCDFKAVQTPELKERCLSGYLAHNERIKRLIPPENLLVFNLSAGDYTPLAEFLGRPVPDEPLPYTDTQCASCKGNETDTE